MLVEPDLQGQVLSLSNRARLALADEAGGLLYLQTRMVNNYFRLQKAERNLSSLTQAANAPGMSAVRQVELERERLGRELHTGVGQLLVAIRLQLEVVAAQFPELPSAVQRSLNRIGSLANDAGEQVRSISRRLHPPEWQRLTLTAAIQQLWDNSGIPQTFEGSLRMDPLPREPEQEVKVLMYRAVQEAITNLVRHSRATRVDITLETRNDQLVLNIQDNGVGFDATRLMSGPANVSQGIGLRSLREQAAALGGRLDIVSGPQGTRLEVAAPFALRVA